MGGGAVIAPSLFNLRLRMRGSIYVSGGGLVEFISTKLPRAFWRRHVGKITVKGANKVIIHGFVPELHPALYVSGSGNVVDIDKNVLFQDRLSDWNICGKNDFIKIHERARFVTSSMTTSGSNNLFLGGESCGIDIGRNFEGAIRIIGKKDGPFGWNLKIGDNSMLRGATFLPASTCDCVFGRNSFISWEFYVWCGSHSILSEDGICLNRCKGVIFGDNIWVGHHVEIPGSISVASGSIIGAGVVLQKNVDKVGSIVSSPSSRILPVGVKWVREYPVMIDRNIKYV